MKALTGMYRAGMYRTGIVAGVSACLALAACTTPVRETALSGTTANAAALASLPTPTAGTPCHFLRPAYTAAERQLGMHGSVRVAYVIDETGHIERAVVVQSSGSEQLDAAARNAVAQGVCAPYRLNGEPRRILQHTTFRFEAGQGSALGALPLHGDDDIAALAMAPQRPPELAARPQPWQPEPGLAAPSVTPPAVPPMPALSLDEALRDAIFDRMGIPPGSPKATLVMSWTRRITEDPDTGRFLGKGPTHANVFALSPPLRAVFFTEAMLRLTPEQRATMFTLIAQAFNNAPADCGGVKSVAVVLSRNLQWSQLSEADIDAYFSVIYAMFKQSALQSPEAKVGVQQGMEGRQAILDTLKNELRSDPQATRILAASLASGASESPALWCAKMRIINHAVITAPQPYRDWFIVNMEMDSLEKYQTLARRSAPAAQPNVAEPNVAPEDYSSRVQRRVRPNVVWAGPIDGLQTSIRVICAPNGTLLSAMVTHGSGNAAWDAAALQAVQHSDPMPVDASGHAPRQFVITLRPVG
ncbi:TonB family protein [Paraburkholderia acidisoli]|uniref:TonB family protein n=1 Tax=Paraburkholderia acidisoli TaxID=2571748 RepID=A0A7Z2GP30_9BURK|nr:TonB family protein [Paraburkholderia acidisoli]QGZ65308.1 TonB family protein [Paraburkholderia acidisoli]